MTRSQVLVVDDEADIRELLGLTLGYRESTESWLGVLGFAQFAAVFFLAPWTGTVADRLDRRHIIITCALVAMVIAAALTVVAALGRATTPVVIAGQYVMSSTPTLMMRRNGSSLR